MSRFISEFTVEPVTAEDSLNAIRLLKKHRLKDGLGWLDCLIACAALRLHLPIATFNEKHFQLYPFTISPFSPLAIQLFSSTRSRASAPKLRFTFHAPCNIVCISFHCRRDTGHFDQFSFAFPKFVKIRENYFVVFQEPSDSGR